MDSVIYFILWVIVQYCFIYVVLHCAGFEHWELFQLAFMSFLDMLACIYLFVSYFWALFYFLALQDDPCS